MVHDTAENQAEYPQQKGQKPGIGFPIARVCAIVSLATACVTALTLGKYAGKETGENALLRQLIDTLSPGDVLVGDRYYCSFMMIALLLGQGVDVCARMHQRRHVDFRRGKRLGKYDHLIVWNRPVRPAWMDEATRNKARLKLEKMAYLIGYPSRWRTYDFEVTQGDHGGNVSRSRSFSIRYDLNKIGKPVDRESWFISPPTVNAFYNPLKNQMVFPAGILQPPFFNPDASVAVNMGAMGMVVGHELTHGFDDQGSQFDGDGNLKSWWTKKVREQFDKRTSCIEKQYAGYDALPGVKLNGKLTLGENIADAGGVKLAFHGYRALRAEAAERWVADGLNEDQQFFVSLGQIWCSKYREAFARLRAKTDTHSSPEWRVNGSLQNLPEFAETFGCQEGSPMRPKNSCSVW